MFDLLPVPQDRLGCPCGQAELLVGEFVLPGMIAFARTSCPACGRRFLSRLHADFCASEEFHYDLESGEIHSNAPQWYLGQLKTMLRTRERQAPAIEKQTRRPLGRDVIIVNALDGVYGHCLHKLFSFSACQNLTGVTFLAIVPHFLKWLVPDAIDEVWIVNEPRFRMCEWNAHIAAEIDALKTRVGRLRYCDLAWGHTVRIEDFTRVKPRGARVAPARIALNWREDRCWTYHGRDLPPEEAVAEQQRLFTLVLETLREQLADLEVYVTGYGRSGEFPKWMKDLRIVEHDAKVEQSWAKIYGISHLAMGVHGSNMILPTAHAQTTVEIVPPEKWQTVMVTWEFTNTLPATNALSRYRLLPISTSLSDVATIALAQIRRMQIAALGWAMRDAGSPADAMALRVAHHDVFTPYKRVVCRDENGAPL